MWPAIGRVNAYCISVSTFILTPPYEDRLPPSFQARSRARREDVAEETCGPSPSASAFWSFGARSGGDDAAPVWRRRGGRRTSPRAGNGHARCSPQHGRRRGACPRESCTASRVARPRQTPSSSPPTTPHLTSRITSASCASLEEPGRDPQVLLERQRRAVEHVRVEERPPRRDRGARATRRAAARGSLRACPRAVIGMERDQRPGSDQRPRGRRRPAPSRRAPCP